MIISLARLPADGLIFEHQFKAGELDTGKFEFEIKSQPFIKGRVDRIGMDMRLRGDMKASIDAPCARCLEDVPFVIETPFDLLYTPNVYDEPDQKGRKKIETEINDRDLDFAVYENDQIDLDQMILEQLELSLPSRVLCKDDCLGLCPECGANLNIEQCSCNN